MGSVAALLCWHSVKVLSCPEGSPVHQNQMNDLIFHVIGPMRPCVCHLMLMQDNDRLSEVFSDQISPLVENEIRITPGD